MKKRIVTIILMALSTLPTLAQIDLHSHTVTQGYLDYIKANGTEMVKSLKLIDTNPMVGMEMLGR
jgi:hypothetical protein